MNILLHEIAVKFIAQDSCSDNSCDCTLPGGPLYNHATFSVRRDCCAGRKGTLILESY